MCKKYTIKKGLMSRRHIRLGRRNRYASAFAASQIGEKPIPVLTGKSAVCFFMKATQVEKEMGKSGVLTKPADLKAFKSYADSVAVMEAESLKVKFQ